MLLLLSLTSSHTCTIPTTSFKHISVNSSLLRSELTTIANKCTVTPSRCACTHKATAKIQLPVHDSTNIGAPPFPERSFKKISYPWDTTHLKDHPEIYTGLRTWQILHQYLIVGIHDMLTNVTICMGKSLSRVFSSFVYAKSHEYFDKYMEATSQQEILCFRSKLEIGSTRRAWSQNTAWRFQSTISHFAEALPQHPLHLLQLHKHQLYIWTHLSKILFLSTVAVWLSRSTILRLRPGNLRRQRSELTSFGVAATGACQHKHTHCVGASNRTWQNYSDTRLNHVPVSRHVFRMQITYISRHISVSTQSPLDYRCVVSTFFSSLSQLKAAAAAAYIRAKASTTGT